MKKIVFCGCGGLYNYSLGIAKIIQELKKEIPEIELEYIGISAGCYPALLLALDLDITKLFYSFNKELLENINKCYLGSFTNWYSYVKKYSLKYIPEDSFKTNNLCISFTTITGAISIENKLINKWESNEDLISCMIASSYIPVFGGNICTNYKGQKCIDGTLTFDYKDCKDTDNILYIYPDKWWEIKYRWYYVFSDFNWAKECYNLGIKHAIENKKYIVDFMLK